MVRELKGKSNEFSPCLPFYRHALTLKGLAAASNPSLLPTPLFSFLPPSEGTDRLLMLNIII